MRIWSCALVGCLLSWEASAQASPCDSLAPVAKRTVSRQTQRAGDRAEELVRAAGPDADLVAIRQRVLKDEFPDADVDVPLSRMLHSYCQVVQTPSGQQESTGPARLQTATQRLRQPVQGPVVLARTSRRNRVPVRSRGAFAPHTTSTMLLVRWTGHPSSAGQGRATEDEFLRDAPPYVNDSNRHFVIVGSVSSEQGAIALMNRLKAKAPKYDFVVYQPYGSNPHYAIMMATWVSRPVALRALRAARAEVVPDAYLWSCRSFGERC